MKLSTQILKLMRAGLMGLVATGIVLMMLIAAGIVLIVLGVHRILTHH